jgi:hypothetical protein
MLGGKFDEAPAGDSSTAILKFKGTIIYNNANFLQNAFQTNTTLIVPSKNDLITFVEPNGSLITL